VFKVTSTGFVTMTTPSSGTACNGVYNGTFNGNITVSAGQTCSFTGGSITGNVQQNGGQLSLSNTGVGGNVQVNGGGTFSIVGSTTINGNLEINNLPTGSALNQVCGSRIMNNLQYQNSGAPVEIGAASACPGNTIGGNLQVGNNTASTWLFNNTVAGDLQDQNNTASTGIVGNSVGGNLQVQNNTGPSTQVSDNAVTKNLQCQNNTAITGGGNTAAQKQGQCTGF
jgi:hypothetical protein